MTGELNELIPGFARRGGAEPADGIVSSDGSTPP